MEKRDVKSVQIVTEAMMGDLRTKAEDPNIPQNERPHSAVAVITLNLSDGIIIDTALMGIVNTDGVYCITKDQISSLSDEKIQSLICKANPAISDFIIRTEKVGKTLSFTQEAKESIYVPFNKSSAAGVIMAFHNGFKDPLERIQSLFQDFAENQPGFGRILTTYYLCCIKYMTDLDMTKFAGKIDGINFLTDDTAIVPKRYRNQYTNMKNEMRVIPPGLIAFHAVYGAYVLCRPVASKKEFRQWIAKRYSAFMASIQSTAETNTNLDIQKGGTQVNHVAVERAQIRKLIFAVIKENFTDVRAAAIKTHVKMLTALSEMTTYSLIQKVISQGGAAVAIHPLPSQLVKYKDERETILEEIKALGMNDSEIVYLHLVLPQKQCFTAAEYSDLVVAAKIIDEVNDPDHKTLDSYTAKTNNAVISKRKLKQFLTAQATTSGLKIDRSVEPQLKELLGSSASELYNEAERILRLMSQQRNMIMDE